MLCLQNWEGNVLTETFTQSQKQIPSSACGSTFVTVGISSREQAVISRQFSSCGKQNTTNIFGVVLPETKETQILLP